MNYIKICCGIQVSAEITRIETHEICEQVATLRVWLHAACPKCGATSIDMVFRHVEL